MAALKTKMQGDSLSIGFTFNAEYDISRIEHHYVYLNDVLVTSSIVDSIIRVELKSNDTVNYISNVKLTLAIDDIHFGIRKTDIGNIYFTQSDRTISDDSVNEGYDLVISIVINETATTATAELLEAFKGNPFVYTDFTPEQLAALVGATGNGITSITRTSGTGAAGTTDTYTITFTDETTTTFNVVNGANGDKGDKGDKGDTGPIEVDGHVSVALSAANMQNSIIHNIGQGANNVNLTLPEVAVSYGFILQCGETSANYLRVTAATAGTMIVDGISGKNYAQFLTPTIGNYLIGFAIKTVTGYAWVISTGAGAVTTN